MVAAGGSGCNCDINGWWRAGLVSHCPDILGIMPVNTNPAQMMMRTAREGGAGMGVSDRAASL